MAIRSHSAPLGGPDGAGADVNPLQGELRLQALQAASSSTWRAYLVMELYQLVMLGVLGWLVKPMERVVVMGR